MRTRYLMPMTTTRALLLAIMVLAAMALLGACASHQKQERPGPDGLARPAMEQPDPQARIAEIIQRLSLADGQVPPVREILETERQAREELRASLGGKGREPSDEMRSKMEDLEWKTLVKLAKILTREQMDAYLGYLDEEKAKMPARGPALKGAKRGRPPASR